MAGNSGTTSTENINEVILRLLRLKPGDELDYQTYAEIIKKKLTSARMVGKGPPAEEDKLLREEFKRVRNKKGRFKLKTKRAKVSSLPPSPSRGGGGNGNNPRGGKIVKSSSGKITADKYFYQYYVEPVNVKDVTKKTAKVSKTTDPLTRISSLLDSILNTLTEINKIDKNKSNKQRIDEENRRRRQKEKDLESKPVEAIKKALSAIVKPFQSIWDKIVNFITNIILGRIVIKLIDWIADPKNQSKIQSIIRFFSDHWPTLLALYLRFGTGIGKFVAKLGGILVKGAFRLGALAAKLASKVGLKGAGKLAGFLGGKKGKAVASGIGIAADVAVTAGTAIGLSKLFGGGEDQKQEPVQQFSGGGRVRIPKFAGGGIANLNKLFGNLGGIGSSDSEGTVKGKKGVDKVPAMLTDGEFVMSVGAVKKYGVDTLEAMNAAGGGTNIPKMSNNIVHASGGGFVGSVEQAQNAWINYLKSPSGEEYKRGGRYYTRNSTEDILSKHGREFMKTYVRTGKPPEWANIGQRTTKVSSAAPNVKTNVDVNYKPTSSSSIVRAQPGALSRNVKSPMQRINTNMNVPGGRIRGGSLSAIMMALEMKQRKDEGQTNAQAGLGAGASALGGQLGWMGGAKAGAIAGAALGSIIPGLGTGVGAAVGAIVGGLAGGYGGSMLGGKLADDFSGVNSIKERNSRGGIGGSIKGGWGLKEQSFKDAPKTQIMTDEKGRPFVGHKALRNGKLHYVRGSQPGTGTSNPLEMLGRMINPGAYRDSDSRLALKKQREVMMNSLENFQSQGMSIDAQRRMMKQMGGNLKDVQNDLNFKKRREGEKKKERQLSMSGNDKASVMRRNNAARISRSQQATKSPVKPLPRSRPNPQVAGGGMNGRRGSGSNPSSGSKAPSFSATHNRGHRTHKETLGIMR